jgi:hypothetical protein
MTGFVEQIEQDGPDAFVATDGPRGPRMFVTPGDAEAYVASGPALLYGDLELWLERYDPTQRFPGEPCARFRADRERARR